MRPHPFAVSEGGAPPPPHAQMGLYLYITIVPVITCHHYYDTSADVSVPRLAGFSLIT